MGIDRSTWANCRPVGARRHVVVVVRHRQRGARLEPRCNRAFWRSRPPGRPARQLPLVCDHVRRRTTSGQLVASIAPRRLLRDHAGKRCGMARRGGRSRGRPGRGICPRRPPRWRPPRWEFSAGPRVRRRPLRWTTIPSRARRPASLRLPVLLRSSTRTPRTVTRIHLPTLLNTAAGQDCCWARRSAGTRRPHGRPSQRDARSGGTTG